MNDNEKLAEALRALPLEYQEMLAQLADGEMRDPGVELLWIIKCCATGRYYDLGDAPATPRITLDGRSPKSDSERVRVRAFRPSQAPPTPKADAI